jgi:WD40 repeat protein
VWEVDTGKSVAVVSGLDRPASALTFAPTGKILAAGEWNGDIGLWHVPEAKRATKLVGHRGVVTALAFSPARPQLVSTSRDSTVRLWDLTTSTFITTQHQAAVSRAMFLDDGRVLASGGSDSQVQFWDTATGSLLHALPVGGRVFGLGYNPRSGSLGVGTMGQRDVTNVVHYRLP